MKIGDRVEWTYEHHLNRNSSTFITKKGTIKRFIGWGNENPKMKPLDDDVVLVHFEGNKHPSRRLYGELKAAK